jgi:hypothetical protein
MAVKTIVTLLLCTLLLSDAFLRQPLYSSKIGLALSSDNIGESPKSLFSERLDYFDLNGNYDDPTGLSKTRREIPLFLLGKRFRRVTSKKKPPTTNSTLASPLFHVNTRQRA